jgi:hypothetical protein
MMDDGVPDRGRIAAEIRGGLEEIDLDNDDFEALMPAPAPAPAPCSGLRRRIMTVVTYRGKDYMHVTNLARHVVTDLARHFHHCLRHCGSLCRDQIPRGAKISRGGILC